MPHVMPPLAQFSDLMPALAFLMLNVFIPGPNVLNTIATAMGSGLKAGMACAFACGAGLLLWALAVLLGAAALFAALPVAKAALTVLGGVLLQYFAFRYLRKSFGPGAQLTAIDNQPVGRAFAQAFMVMMTNPKVLTTWLAVISLFPVIASDALHISLFTLMAGGASFAGHALFATLFASQTAGRIYLRLYRPINALVGIRFSIYGLKLLSGLLPT